MQGERYGGAGIPAAVDADGAAELFGCILYLPEAIGAVAIEIDTGIADPDHGAFAHFNGFDVDTFALGAVNGAIQEIPQDKGQQVLVGAHFQIPVYLIDYDCFSAYGTGEEARRQFIYKTVKGYSFIYISSH